MKTAYIYLMGALLLLAGCQDEDNTPQIDRGPRVAVKFSAVNVEISPMTRATETAFENGDAIGISVVNRSMTGTDSLVATGNYADNYKYTYNATNLEFETETEGIWQYKTLPFHLVYYAIYPYSVSIAPTFTFEVETDQTLDGAFTASDLCFQKIDTTDVNINFELSHMMSNVEVHVQGDHLDELSDINVTLADVMTEAIIDLNWEVDTVNRKIVTATGEPLTNVVLCKETETSSTERTFSALIPPQQIPVENKFVKLSISTSAGTQYFAIGFSHAKTLYSGKKTKIYCELEQDTNGTITITYAGPENQSQHPDSRQY